MATVGYLEGMDPLVLSKLAVQGVGTLPLSNGFDNHGKFINTITERDQIELIVGYLHKIMRTQDRGFFPQDILQACHNCLIPVLIIIPNADHEAARQILGEACDFLILVDPADVYDEIAVHLNLGS